MTDVRGGCPVVSTSVVPVGAGVSVMSKTNAPIAPPLPFSYTGALVSGQSLSIGAHSIPPLTTTPRGNVQLHDSTGTYANPASNTWSVVPLVAPIRADKYQDSQANTSPYPSNVNGESPDVALANTVSSLMSGIVLPSNAGQGSASSLVIQKNGSGNAYQSLLNEVDAAHRLLGSSYGVGSTHLVHGESDFATHYYDRFMTSYQSQLEADCKAITGQSGTIPLIYSQQTSYPGAGSVFHDSILACAKALRLGKHVVRTGVSSAWDSGAITTGTLTGNGYVEWTISSLAGTFQCGLTHLWVDASNTWIQYSLQLGGACSVYETSTFRGTFAVPQVGDVYRIQVTGTTVTYLRNGVVFYTSPTAATLPLSFQVALRDPFTCVSNVRFSTGASVEPWLHVAGEAVACDSAKLSCAGPEYPHQYYTDFVHMVNVGSQQIGEQQGRCTAVRLRGDTWRDFIGTATRSGNDVTITFQMQVEPLVWDTLRSPPHQSGALSAWANGKGFEARSGGATGTIVTINSVAIVGTNQVRVSCATQPDYIAYALTGDRTNPSLLMGGFPDGRCGLLHDSDPFVGPVTGLAMPNWCMVDEWTGL